MTDGTGNEHYILPHEIALDRSGVESCTPDAIVCTKNKSSKYLLLNV